MSKSCDICTLKFKYSNRYCVVNDKKPLDSVCDSFEYRCEECIESADYIYKGARLCFNCLKDKLGIEEVTIATYYVDGEYIGSESDNILDVLRQVDSSVAEIE